MNRLGASGPMEVKQHPWIRNYDWANLENKTMASPFIPVIC